MKKTNTVEMFVGGLVIDPNTQTPIVILKDENNTFCLPIWIGVSEATSIATALKELQISRPLTHDLLCEILHKFGGKLERIIITELRDGTYYSELYLSKGDSIEVLDSRPSDALALAIREHVPIFVTEEVLSEAKMVFNIQKQELPPEEPHAGESPEPNEVSEANEDQSQSNIDFKSIDKTKWDEILSQMNPDDFKYKI